MAFKCLTRTLTVEPNRLCVRPSKCATNSLLSPGSSMQASTTAAGQSEGGSRRFVRLKAARKVYPTEQDVEFTRPRRPLDLRTRDKSIEVYYQNTPGSGRTEGEWTTISSKWIRDNCMCRECFNQDTAQRQISVLKGNVECRVREVRDHEQDQLLQVIFEDEHSALIPKRMIVDRTYGRIKARHGLGEVEMWGATIARDPPSVRYEQLQAQGLGGLLKNICRKGFCFVDNTPPTPEATQSLLEAIGPIRNTHYGGFYDFTSDLRSKDTAYTSESLEPHTDNTYFTEPAGLQALHLLSHTEGTGGESSLVDGFAAARQLFQQDREAYHGLSNIGVYGHASGNDGISIQPADAYPVLSHHSILGRLMQVRWNNADRAGLSCHPNQFDWWYNAASKFDALLNDSNNVYEFQLTPGRLLIFDNWRVLHGRAAFTGKRRMCGGYINHDDFISKYRQTNMSKEEIRESTVTG